MASFLRINHREPRSRVDNNDHYEDLDLDEMVALRDGFDESLTWPEIESLRLKQQQLEESLAQLRTVKAFARSNKAKKALAAAEENASYIRDNLVEKLYRVIPTTNRPNEQSTAKAEEVFRIPELLERIILCLPIADQLTTMAVNKSWNATLFASITILRTLGLRPADPKTGHYTSPFTTRLPPSSEPFQIPNMEFFDSEPPWNYLPKKSSTALSSHSRNRKMTLQNRDWFHHFITLKTSPTPHPQNLTFHISNRPDAWLNVDLPTRIRKMYLVQPPISNLHAQLMTYADYVDPSPGQTSSRGLHSSDPVGFTVGEFFDLMAEIRAEHKRKVENGEHSPKDETKVFIEVWGEVKLAEDDPIYKARLRDEDVKRWFRRRDGEEDSPPEEESSEEESSDEDDD